MPGHNIIEVHGRAHIRKLVLLLSGETESTLTKLQRWLEKVIFILAISIHVKLVYLFKILFSYLIRW